jgi:hypothetical protein
VGGEITRFQVSGSLRKEIKELAFLYEEEIDRLLEAVISQQTKDLGIIVRICRHQVHDGNKRII